MQQLISDLSLIASYFEGHTQTLYEDELIKDYGKTTVLHAIRDGILEHRWIPCKKGQKRCICWLSDKGKTHIPNRAF